MTTLGPRRGPASPWRARLLAVLFAGVALVARAPLLSAQPPGPQASPGPPVPRQAAQAEQPAQAAQAAQPASTRAPLAAPQVRVVQDMHTAPIDQIRADANRERVVTISSDKTVRLWRTADLRLMRTVYLPSEPGSEGTPYALAVTADGRTAYVAGITGWEWRRSSQLYVVDLASGQVTGTLGRFDGAVVSALDLSPDGHRLAVGLFRGALVVIELATQQVVFSDTAYRRKLNFIHHAPDGRLVTSSDDGCMRVYERDGTLAYRAEYPPRPDHELQCQGRELGGVRFSPDGRWIALGTGLQHGEGRWTPEVPVFDGASYELRRVVRVDEPRQRSLCCIAWSPDSSTLFVNGAGDGEDATPLYRIRDPLQGTVERWNVGREQFSNMLPLADGSVIFATTAPSLARVGPTGRLMHTARGEPLEALPENVDFHRRAGDAAAFRLSPDGRAVAFEAVAGRWLQLDLRQEDPAQVLQAVDGASTAAALRPARRSGALRVETALGPWSYAQAAPRVNGHPVALAPQEGVRSWALHPQGDRVAFGTQRRLHLVDGQGRPVPGWTDPPFLPAPLHHTAFSEDGRWLVVAVGDGTLRWFDVATGQERLGAFVAAGGQDWAAWRADGYYASSPRGDHYVGWLINRGERSTPELFRAVQFERTLYRPDHVRAALTGALDGTLAPGADAAAVVLASLAAPRVRIERIDERTRELHFRVDPAGQRVREVGVYADGIPILSAGQRRFDAADASGTRRVRIPANLPLDRIRVEAEADTAIGIDEQAVLHPTQPDRATRGKLWVVAIGVDTVDEITRCRQEGRCRVRIAPLPNAPIDARVLSETLRQRVRGSFSEVSATVLTRADGTAPTKAAILAALQPLRQATADDTVLVFIASHGFAAGRGEPEYYVLPADGQPEAVEQLASSAGGAVPPAPEQLSSLLSATELTAALRPVAGRRLLVVDTCRAGAAGVGTNTHLLAKRSAAAQLAVFSAATGDERSYELADGRVRHGAFTHALIEALRGAADRDRDGAVSVDEALEYVGPAVRRNTEQLNRRAAERDPQHQPFTQTPVLYAPRALRDSRL